MGTTAEKVPRGRRGAAANNLRSRGGPQKIGSKIWGQVFTVSILVTNTEALTPCDMLVIMAIVTTLATTPFPEPVAIEEAA